MRICSNASVARDVLMMHSMCLLKFHPYIYEGESPKSMKLPMDSSSVTQSFCSHIVISSPTCVYRPTKVEKFWREAFRSLYSCFLPMDIVCLNTTSVWTY